MDGLSALFIIIIISLFSGLLIGAIIIIRIPRPPTIVYMPVDKPSPKSKLSFFPLMIIVTIIFMMFMLLSSVF